MKQHGNTMLVTDGTEGFQFELAKAFVLSGNHVIVCSGDRAELESARNKLPQLRTYHARISDPAERTALFELLSRNHPNLNVLVNSETLCSCLDRTGNPAASGRYGTGSLSNAVATEFLSYFGGKRNTAILNVCGASLARGCPHTGKLKSILRKTAVSVIEVVPPSRFSRLVSRLLAAVGGASENRDVEAIVKALAKGKARVLGEFDSRYLSKPASYLGTWFSSRLAFVAAPGKHSR
jgi:uncharacterized oxidoreductase